MLALFRIKFSSAISASAINGEKTVVVWLFMVFVFVVNALFPFLHQIGDYLLTLPQQLEPFITQENPALEAAMKAGNLPFPDVQGMAMTASQHIKIKCHRTRYNDRPSTGHAICLHWRFGPITDGVI